MAEITFKGVTVHTEGEFPKVGTLAPDFNLVDGDLEQVKLSDFKGKKKLLNIVPSLDTPVCIKSTKIFNEAFKKENNAVCLTISSDLPFAQKRFCEAENALTVKTLSTMNSSKFAVDYGVLLIDGPLRGLTTRAVLVLDKDNQVIHGELVSDIGQEPNYDKAISQINSSSSCEL